MSSQQSDYPLQVGSLGQERLTILNELYNPATQQFIIDCGLQAGMSVLEVGCGTGVMACWLAEQVGPNGKVVAIDQSAEQIAVAQQNAHAKGLTNIQFLALSVENLDQLTEQFDLAFSRWVLCFIPNPIAGLTAMHAALKPNGLLITSDLDVGNLGCFSYPRTEAIDRWMDLWIRLFKTANKELYFAQNLYAYLTKLHCHSFKINFLQPSLISAREKSVVALAAKELHESVVNSGVMSVQEIDTLIKELEQLTQQPGVIGFIRTLLISARK